MPEKDHTPKVSVRLPAYNHEKYIGECIDSVLHQTFQDFEIVVTDDCSSDRTAEMIRAYDDDRILLHINDKNKGSAFTVSECAGRARGKYIANLCSDDAWEQDKLQKQVDFLDTHPDIDAVFTGVTFMDDSGKELKVSPDSAFATVFNVPNRSRQEWLRFFFFYGNCLCIPSVMIRSNVYRELNFQDKRMANLSDFDLWVRFCLSHELHILDEKLTRFRLLPGEANASGDKPETHRRSNFEYKQIMDQFLYIGSAEELESIFPECITYGTPSSDAIPYLLGRLACDTDNPVKQLWGLEVLFDFMRDEKNTGILESRYHFTYVDLHRMTGRLDPFRMWSVTALKEADKKLEQKEREILLLERTHREIRDSTSWKITRPLRAFGKYLIKRKEG